MHHLSAKSIDSLFARLQVRYGFAFLQQYEGLKLALVKEDWAQQLAAFSPEAMYHALDNLPDGKPVNVMSFRALCRQWSPPAAAALPPPPPRPVPAEFRVAMEKLRTPVKHDEPLEVVIARRFVAMWGRPDAGPLSPRQRIDLERYAKVIAAHEAAVEADKAAQAANEQAQAS